MNQTELSFALADPEFQEGIAEWHAEIQNEERMWDDILHEADEYEATRLDPFDTL